MRSASALCVAVSLLCVGPALPAAAESDLGILTYPVGLVTGQLEVHLDLGASQAPAVLLLDGRQVCAPIAGATTCRVNLGPEPSMHLLELVRRDPTGTVTESAVRWINRPGQEATLTIVPAAEGRRSCSARIDWVHPDKLGPAALDVTLDGKQIKLKKDGRTVEYRCPDPNRPQVLAASAVFTDGRRAEAVAVLGGGFGGEAASELTAVAIEPTGDQETTCQSDALLPPGAERLEKGGFEVVFVLDPSAGYSTLFQSGWFAGRMPADLSPTTKAFDQLVRTAPSGSEPRPRSSWTRTEKSVYDAERLWFVIPDSRLARMNGFGQGRMNWLRLLFGAGQMKLDSRPRIADAVAASGMVAGAGPRRRAVVLLLGDSRVPDASRFTAAQAQAYLAEVGVPLFVLRNGRVRDDGWPQGMPARNMESMAETMEVVQARLERQCVAWFPGEVNPSSLVQALPEEIRLAGAVAAPTASAWEGIEEPEDDTTEPASGTFSGRMEITAVSLLISAVDSEGAPVTDLSVDDVDVAEDGFPVQVLDLKAFGGTTLSADTAPAALPAAAEATQAETVPLPISIYLERRLAGSGSLTPILEALAEEVPRLVAAGPVEVVLSDNAGLKTELQATRDAEVVTRILGELADAPRGGNQIASMRKRFVRDIRALPKRISDDAAMGTDARGLGGDIGSTPAVDRSRVKMDARAAMAEEYGAIRACADRLHRWAMAPRGRDPRLLVLIGASFDEDPKDFYLPFVEKREPHHAAELRSEMERLGYGDQVLALANDLAGAGWRVLAADGQATPNIMTGAEFSGSDRFQSFLSNSAEVIRTHDAAWFLNPIASQRRLAAPSGGDVVVGTEALHTEIDRMAGWYRLTYQLDRPADGALHAVEVLPRRAGITVHRPEVIASETSEGQAAARLTSLIEGDEPDGGLPVTIKLSGARSEGDRRAAELVAQVDLGPVLPVIERNGEARLRVSVLVRVKEAAPFILHRVEQVTGSGEGTMWSYTVPLQWPRGSGKLALVAEDLATGAWGGATAALP